MTAQLPLRVGELERKGLRLVAAELSLSPRSCR